MRTWTIAVAVTLLAATAAADPPAASQPEAYDWTETARRVHGKFTGRPGTVGQFGDSITYSKAFFSHMFWGPYKGEPKLDEFRRVVPRACADWKGPPHANMGGWQVEDVLRAIDAALKADNPEIAFLMIGTNDLRRQADPAKKDFAGKLDTLIGKILDNGTVLVLHTVPPFKGRMEAVAAYNQVIRQAAAKHRLPLIDYCGEVLARRPDDWLGTLIHDDGVHPSFPKDFQADFTDEGLRNSGYTLRNWLAVRMWQQVRDALAGPASAPADG